MKTKCQRMFKILDISANSVQIGIERVLSKHFLWVQTLTINNGKEFLKHKSIAENLGIIVFFLGLYSPWQRGLNENQDTLIRKYIHKCTSLETVNYQDIESIATCINNRTRDKILVSKRQKRH
jgi:IS30 family transposase